MKFADIHIKIFDKISTILQHKAEAAIMLAFPIITIFVNLCNWNDDLFNFLRVILSSFSTSCVATSCGISFMNGLDDNKNILLRKTMYIIFSLMFYFVLDFLLTAETKFAWFIIIVIFIFLSLLFLYSFSDYIDVSNQIMKKAEIGSKMELNMKKSESVDKINGYKVGSLNEESN